MKRREALLSLAGTTLGAAVTPELVEAIQGTDLTEGQIEALLRAVAKVEPAPGEANRVSMMLSQLRSGSRSETDPRVQPSFSFSPEVEI